MMLALPSMRAFFSSVMSMRKEGIQVIPWEMQEMLTSVPFWGLSK